MSNLDGLGVLPPANEDAWEKWVAHALHARYEQTPNAYGRRGQKQYGIDFVVSNKSERIGVQCKFVSQGRKLNIQKVKKDLYAARAISPELSRFVLYTSADSDAETVDALDELKLQAQRDGVEFDFEYLMWREFEEEVRRHDLFDRLFGTKSLEPSSVPATAPGTAATQPKNTSENIGQDSTQIHAVPRSLYSEMLDGVQEKLVAGNTVAANTLVDHVLRKRDEISDDELARAYATKAILEGRADNMAGAARYWHLAAETEPSEDKRHGRQAQALLCQDKYEDALAAAMPGLETQPPSPLAAITALISSQHLGRREEIETRLGGRLKGERDVQIIRAHLAMADNDSNLAEEIVEELEPLYQDDTDLLSLRADLLLAKVIGGPHEKRHAIISGESRRALEKAIDLYRKAIRRRDPVGEKAIWLPTALNLISALKLLEQHEEAANIASTILEKFGRVDENFDRLILMLAEGSQEQQALSLSDEAENPTVLLQIARASALMHLDRFAEAQKLLEKQTLPGDDLAADNIAWMLLTTHIHADPQADIANLTKEFFEAARDKLAACGRIIENLAHLAPRDLIDEYAKKAFELYRSDPNPNYLLIVADALLHLDDKHTALELLLPQVDLNSPNGGPIEERVAYCLLHLQKLESLGKLLNGLPNDITDIVRFDSYRIEHALALGDHSAALDAVRNAIRHKPNDMKLQALETWLLRKEGALDNAREKLIAINYQTNAPLSAIALYVNEARELSMHDEADAMAYRWIRDHGEQSDGAAWFLTSTLFKRPSSSGGELTEVTSRCGICLHATQGDKATHWLVIDDRYPEDTSKGWFAPDSTHVPEILGRQRKEVVHFGAFPGGPFVIEAISPVFEGAFQLVQNRYGKQLPMVSGLQYVSLKGDDGEIDLNNIFKALDEKKEAAERALSIYAKKPIPLAVLSRTLGTNPVDGWLSLVGSGQKIRAMSGDQRSAELFSERLGDDKPNIVIDPLTLLGWHTFDLLDLVERSVESMSMTVSAVEVIKNKLAELAETKSQPEMVVSAGDKPGQYQRTDITPQDIEAQRNRLEAILAWIHKNVTVVPTPTTGLSEDVYSAMRLNLPGYIADSFQLSAHDRRILIADDIGIETLGLSLRTPQTPTAALLRAAATTGTLSGYELANALRKLANAGYEFTSFNAEDLYELTDTLAITIPPEVAQMLNYLQNESLNLESGLKVVCTYLAKLASAHVPTNQVTGCVTLSLSALSHHATRQTPNLYSVIKQFAKKYLPDPYLTAAEHALAMWLKGHFLTEHDLGLA